MKWVITAGAVQTCTQRTAGARGGRGVASLGLFCSVRAEFGVEVTEMAYVGG